MGLISAGLGAVGGTLSSQWKEYFYADALPDNVLATRALKKTKSRFGGSRVEDDNVITEGSVIAVADGQCMMVVDQGRIVDFCAEPGEYVFDKNGEPSLFCGALDGEKARALLEATFHRLSFGGQAGRDQRVYYVNTREIPGNKYGTPSPVPFRVVDANIGLDMDIGIRCFGEYSYRVTNPMLFYANVCGNVEGDYTRDRIDSQLKSELLTALQPAFARISEQGIRYSALPGHTLEIAQALNDVLSEKWANLRGVEIVSFGVNSVKASEEDEAMMKELQRNAVFRNANMAAAHLVGAQAHAGRGEERERRVHRLHGHEHGAGQRRKRRAVVPDGRAAAAGRSAAGPGKQLDLRLRRDGHRQILPGVRREKARARGRLDLLLRRDGHRQILPGVRREEARGRRLDLLLRRGEQGPLLLRVRREEARGRAALPMRQVRLGARRSGASAEVLPAVRRPV